MQPGSLVPLIAAIAVVAPVAPATAAEVRPFTARAFAAAQAQGRPILVDVYADWCPVCRRQAPLISGIIQGSEFDDLIVFRLNFDEQEQYWRGLGVQRQSTLIAFRGRTETGRSVGSTDRQAIERLVRSSLRR